MDEVRGEMRGPLTQFRTALRIDISHQLRVNQAIEMEAHRNVIVARAARTVRVPAIAEVVTFHGGEMIFQRLRIGRHTAIMKANLHQNRKEVPVIIRDILGLALL